MPSDPIFLAAVAGALLTLTEADKWEAYGTVTPEAAADYAMQMLLDWYDSENSMIGTIVAYVTAAPPRGVLPCEGQRVDVADHTALAAVVDPSWIDPQDETQIILPDLRGRTVLGAGNGWQMGAFGGGDGVATGSGAYTTPFQVLKWGIVAS